MQELSFQFRKYRINIYVADRTNHTEPFTYAWEILDAKDELIHHITDYSRRDYAIHELNTALQDAIDHVSLLEETEYGLFNPRGQLGQ